MMSGTWHSGSAIDFIITAGKKYMGEDWEADLDLKLRTDTYLVILASPLRLWVFSSLTAARSKWDNICKASTTR